jgi:dTDP-4-amino-4,6-dideoxygalactose transaminase
MANVLSHGSYIMGPEVDELEAALAERSTAAHVATCASGTDALVLALLALGIRPGDVVAVPTFTFVATAEAVALLGGVPLFVDVEADTYNLDPAKLEVALDWATGAGHRVVGVVPVDLFGQPADHDAVRAVADRHGCWVLVDAAQSFGGARGEVPVGSDGVVSTTSFFPAKPLGCYGDGGAVFTNDPSIDAAIRSLRMHGMGNDRYEHVRIGLCGRLDTLQAAILLVKLSVFDDELAARQQVADRYTAALADRVVTPVIKPGRRSAWAQYTIRVAHRDAVARRLAEQGIPTAVYYPIPLHRQPAYVSALQSPEGFPVADDVCEQVLSLPMHPYLDAATQQTITDAVVSATELAA